MKPFSSFLACVGLIPAFAPATWAQVRHEGIGELHIAAGDLEDAVESLGKQAGVNVLYPGDLLKGRTTAGVDGKLSPPQAFTQLLEGTSLTFTEERGALRIAKASVPASAAVPTPALADSAARIAAPPANWVQHEIRISCVQCDWSGEVGRMLEQLGATEISAQPQFAAFHSLAPAAEGNEVASRLGMSAHWETVKLDLASITPNALSTGERASWPDNLRTRILPLFTTRNLKQSGNLLSVDVLVADATPAEPECRRVLQGRRIQRYCGTPEQWQDLRVRVGFRCRGNFDEGRVTGSRVARSYKGQELCASAAEWKRVDLAVAMQRGAENLYRNDEAAASTERNHPTNTFTPTPVYQPPQPAPAPPPAQ